jgi:hypothetical protein
VEPVLAPLLKCGDELDQKSNDRDVRCQQAKAKAKSGNDEDD